MHRPRFHQPGAILAALVFIGLLAGCSSDNETIAPTTDEAELSALVTSDDEYADYFDLGTGFGEPSAGLLAPGLPIGLAPVEELLGWHRERETVTHTVTSEIAEGIAHVTHDATIGGTFHLRAVVGGETGHYTKPMVSEAHRSATFERRATPRADGRRWALVSVSGTRVESAVDGNPPTVGIGSITLQVTGHDPIVIEDPSIEMPKDQIPTFPPGAEVTVTVVSTGAAARAYLHTGGRHGSPRARTPFEATGSGFEGTWRVPMHPGIYHAAVDLLAEPTLFETEAADGPYDSVAWEVPYRVATE